MRQAMLQAQVQSQKQELHITQELVQAIRILQLPAADLERDIAEALSDNPMLEREDGEDGEDGIQLPPGRGVAAAFESSPGSDVRPEAGCGDSPVLSDFIAFGASTASGDGDSGDMDFAGASSTPSDLRAHLSEQLDTRRIRDRERLLGRVLIACLDEDGYLRDSLEEVMASLPEDLRADEDETRLELSTVLRLIQTFDPPGVAASDVRELLLLQLEDRRKRVGTDPDLDLARKVVATQLDAFAEKRDAAIRRALGCSAAQLKAAAALIASLDPHPGAAFSSDRAETVIPEVIVRKRRGRWICDLNGDAMPKLRLHPMADTIAGSRGSGALGLKIEEAEWLLASLHQRYDTILRVACAIVARQQGFFVHGEIAIRPLMMEQIAEDVGINASTVSRACAGKFMATPHGLKPFGRFFTRRDVADCAPVAVRELMHKLIGAENKGRPLSDQKVADVLAGEGIVVARRTVAKYREALRILPAAQRRVPEHASNRRRPCPGSIDHAE